ncbi:MAG TPA: putative toxin-antitoxin system toxin component, PIN family [Tepidisphaeraceae bacterium]
MIIVLDTNVIVSAALKQGSPPDIVLQRVLRGELDLCYDGRILGEYRHVMLREKFGFDPQDVEKLLQAVEQLGIPVNCEPLEDTLPDPDDNKFLEAAIAAGADYLITGNVRHYPEPLRVGVVVQTPRSFLDLHR